MKQPVEVFRVKDAKESYFIAHTEEDKYILFKLRSPWYGFLNLIPGVSVARKGQIIDAEIAKQWIYIPNSDERENGSGTRVGLAMIAGILLNAGFLEYSGLGHVYLLITAIILGFLAANLYASFTDAQIKKQNKLIQDFKPNIEASIYNPSIGVRLLMLCMLVVALLPLGSFQIFAMFMFSMVVNITSYNNFVDAENLEDTNNRIKILNL
ncbi:hypothetical protein ESZ50_10955 [Weissella muntiaci]|uniref:Uncharacterized protein n=1 Tax=Weissella muntiaci TaxID=2508881 RepID=A0A6C2C3Q2_9LACO|nr:hypothetical protein [Weissella muntiaci]TYC47865.1 hypothetical protein ESZ50_10955 [Weissella muntiaci]